MKRFILSLFLIATPAFAQDLSPKDEARFNELGKEIRCVVCQSEPVATSSAKIAQDMREVIKVRIKAGDSDDEIRKYFAEHYGEFVLLRPNLNSATLLLWLAPLFLLAVGGIAAFLHFRKPLEEAQALSKEELEEINRIRNGE